MSAQLVHAAGESITELLPPHTNAVVLAVESEEELRNLSKKLQLGEIKHVLVTEIDPPYTGQATAIGIVPVKDRKEVKKFLSNLPLLGKENTPG